MRPRPRLSACPHLHRRLPRLRRNNGSLASRTALPAPAHAVPSPNAPLHAALVQLNALVPQSVDQARLSLALAGLEAPRPTVRYALLGLGREGFEKAKMLARTVLADPLREEQEWERRMKEMKGAGILRAYEGSGAGLEVVEVESRVLEDKGVEILVGAVQEGTGPDECLVPVLQNPLAGSGRAGWVRFPVHRAVVVASGVKGALAVEGMGREGLVGSVVDLPIPGAELDVTTTNVDAAERSLEAFRRDVSTGPAFSETWQESGLAALKEGLFEEAEVEGKLRSAVKKHIVALLDDTKVLVEQAEQTALTAVAAQSVSDNTRNQLQTAITSWSEYAHTDLQNSLTYAFESRTWRRTAFPRIIWRIDDVTFSSTEILHSHFLVETETYLAFLTGRIGEAGFFGDNTPPTTSAPAVQTEEDIETARRSALAPSASSILRLDTLSARLRAETGIDTSVVKPWPRGIEITRQSILRGALPALHRRAQALVLQCFGTVGSMSALGAWYVAATAGQGLFEAGAIVGVGLVFALRRLQRIWGLERTKFEGEVREQGRIVLGEIEGLLRGTVRDSKRFSISAADKATWTQAKDTIDDAKKALEKL